MSGVSIRKAQAGDAATIARLANALCLYHGQSGETFSEAGVLADGFGPDPAFAVLLAEGDGEALGYALYGETYNTDLAARGLWLHDIYVVEPRRGEGVGRKLMAAVAAEAVARGLPSVWWGVLSSNESARAAYAAMGARDEEARIIELDGEALWRLAATHGDG